jgi:hypothetical protein
MLLQVGPSLDEKEGSTLDAYQHLGDNENAAKTQIWCVVSTYVLFAIVEKEQRTSIECLALHIATDSYLKAPDLGLRTVMVTNSMGADLRDYEN